MTNVPDPSAHLALRFPTHFLFILMLEEREGVLLFPAHFMDEETKAGEHMDLAQGSSM